MDLVGEPPHDPLAAAARERSEETLATLAVGPPFRVVGLVAPLVTPAVLAEAGTVDEAWQRVSLAYGEHGAAAGPYLTVICEPAGLVAGELADVLAAERSRITDPPPPPAPPPARSGAQPTTLFVDGSPIAARKCGDELIWVARAPLDPFVTVTVVVRGLDSSKLRLSTVDSLEPFLRAREAELARLRAERTALAPAQLELPPAQGLQAHEGLIRLCLGYTDAARTTPGAEHRALLPHTDAAVYRRAWELATRAQMRYAGQDRPEAVAAVTAMVNQAGTLAEKAGWFGDQRLRERAIAEIARHTAFDSDVRSRDAQRVWLQAWTARSSTAAAKAGTRSREWFMDVAATEAVFLTAWQHWADLIR